MTWIVAYPKPLVERAAGEVLTFIVPAPRGCNLKCAYCIIAQRNERHAGAAALTPADYAAFVHGAAEERRIACVAIQGEEPLLPEALPYTYALLAAARKRGILSSLVTNGTHLAAQVEALESTGIELLCVSLDSDKPAIHDKSRGVKGAFQATQEGLQAAVPVFGERLLVSSVLLPGRPDRLIGMPRYLAGMGIRRWCINPYIRIAEQGVGGPAGGGDKLALAIRRLNDEARRYGIQSLVCDDLNQFAGLRATSACLRSVPFKVLDREVDVFRLLPDGACAYGTGILAKKDSAAPVWQPREQSPSAFLTSVVAANRR